MGTFNFKGSEVLDGLSLCIRFEDEQEEGCCWEVVKDELDFLVKHDDNFYYLKIEDKPGYYEGLEYDISFERGEYCDYDYLESTEEKKDVVKELKELKHLILKLIDNGMWLETIGWCPAEFKEQKAKNLTEEIINKHIVEVIKRPLEDFED